MTDVVLIPYGPGFLQLTGDEYTLILARGLAYGPNAPPAPPGVAEERLLDSRELAAVLGIGSTTAEAMAADGRIPSFRIGRALRFKKSEVELALRPRDSVTPARVQPHELNGQKRRHNQKTTGPIGVRS